MIDQTFRDIPRWHTALAEWASCMTILLAVEKGKKRPAFWAFSLLILLVLLFFLRATDQVPLVLWIPCMLTAFLLMLLIFAYGLDTGMGKNVYLVFRAFILAEFAASLEWQLHIYLMSQYRLQKWQPFCLTIFIYFLVFAIAAFLERRMADQAYTVEITYKEVFTAGLIAIGIFAFSNLSYINPNTPFSSVRQQEVFNIRTLVDLGGLAVLYAYQSRLQEMYSRSSLDKVNAILKGQYDNYRRFQESLNLINIKYHDMKHLLVALETEEDPAKRSGYLLSLRQELEEYKPDKQTGSHVLDTIIASKREVCRKNQIEMTCVADGRLLSFMHVTDLCSIFGNALDNAVEAAILAEEPEKRYIHMNVSARKNFLFISVRNYSENKVQIKDGFPVTTKKDKSEHGYGVRSMDLSVRKYGGSLRFESRDQEFELIILIPLPKNQ